MQPLRRLARTNPALIGAMLALALAMKLLMPAGFMPALADGQFTISICSGTERVAAIVTIPGTERSAPGKANGKTDQQCAFAGLSAPSLGGTDPIQLAALILFIIALGLSFAARRQPLTAVRLRPPLRAPPALT